MEKLSAHASFYQFWANGPTIFQTLLIGKMAAILLGPSYRPRKMSYQPSQWNMFSIMESYHPRHFLSVLGQWSNSISNTVHWQNGHHLLGISYQPREMSSQSRQWNIYSIMEMLSSQGILYHFRANGPTVFWSLVIGKNGCRFVMPQCVANLPGSLSPGGCSLLYSCRPCAWCVNSALSWFFADPFGTCNSPASGGRRQKLLCLCTRRRGGITISFLFPFTKNMQIFDGVRLV